MIVSFCTLILAAGALGWFQKNYNYHPTWGSLGFLMIATAYISFMCLVFIILSLTPRQRPGAPKRKGLLGILDFFQKYNFAYVEIAVLFTFLAFMACDAAAMANDYDGFLNCDFYNSYAPTFYQGELYGIMKPNGFDSACKALNACVVMSFVVLLGPVFMFFGVVLGLIKDKRPAHHTLPPMNEYFYRRRGVSDEEKYTAQ